MALPVTIDLDAYRGDTWAQTFRFLEDDTPANLDPPVEVDCWAQSLGGEPVEMRVTVGEAPGEVTIAQPEDGLGCGAYSYDVQVRDGAAVTTWVRGTLSVAADITRPNGASPAMRRIPVAAGT